MDETHSAENSYFVCLLSVNEVCDSLLKAGYMGTMLVMSEASYLDSEDDASSVNKTTGLTETLIFSLSLHIEKWSCLML